MCRRGKDPWTFIDCDNEKRRCEDVKSKDCQTCDITANECCNTCKILQKCEDDEEHKDLCENIKEVCKNRGNASKMCRENRLKCCATCQELFPVYI